MKSIKCIFGFHDITEFFDLPYGNNGIMNMVVKCSRCGRIEMVWRSAIMGNSVVITDGMFDHVFEKIRELKKKHPIGGKVYYMDKVDEYVDNFYKNN